MSQRELKTIKITKAVLTPFLMLAISFSACHPRERNDAAQQLNLMNTNLMDLKPAPSSSENDFDFLQGKWQVHNRKLTVRLANNNTWSEFESELHMRKTLFGNVENYYATFAGKPFEGMAIRFFDPQTKLWRVYWVDSNSRAMDEHPVTGSFENGVGKLYANASFNGRPIVVLYQWDATNPSHPKWSQAFSDDAGKTWEWNWEMTLTRIE